MPALKLLLIPGLTEAFFDGGLGVAFFDMPVSPMNSGASVDAIPYADIDANLMSQEQQTAAVCPKPGYKLRWARFLDCAICDTAGAVRICHGLHPESCRASARNAADVRAAEQAPWHAAQ